MSAVSHNGDVFTPQNSSSERPRTGGILIRSEFCIKLVFSRHTRKYVGKKCTRMYTSGQAIFKKANGERLFRTDKDVGGSIQKRVCLQTRSPRMYTDVHSWAGLREYLKGSLMRLSCASESVLCPKADNRFEAVNTEALCEHISLFFAALPLLIGIIVISF